MQGTLGAAEAALVPIMLRGARRVRRRAAARGAAGRAMQQALGNELFVGVNGLVELADVAEGLRHKRCQEGLIDDALARGAGEELLGREEGRERGVRQALHAAQENQFLDVGLAVARGDLLQGVSESVLLLRTDTGVQQRLDRAPVALAHRAEQDLAVDLAAQELFELRQHAFNALALQLPCALGVAPKPLLVALARGLGKHPIHRVDLVLPML
mmetsp:Transcript_77038/g.195528  ORF Transcript_77038/g.195528 Transcript_77038/m.195528 type:complete len:214 (+) Transcript_77038:139-780(+)